jgi:hypothetical protein
MNMCSFIGFLFSSMGTAIPAKCHHGVAVP